MNNVISEMTNLYFSAFIKKDLELLKSLYDDNVELIDWTGQWYGKDSVLVANEELFKSEYDLIVEETNIIENKSFNSLSIRFDEGLIEVLDIIYFNKEGKIIKIRAYKG